MTCKDHCHRTGCFRGATHQQCNLTNFKNRYVPVVFHNLKGYDGHLIIKEAFEMNNQMGTNKIDGIPNSNE